MSGTPVPRISLDQIETVSAWYWIGLISTGGRHARLLPGPRTGPVARVVAPDRPGSPGGWRPGASSFLQGGPVDVEGVDLDTGPKILQKASQSLLGASAEEFPEVWDAGHYDRDDPASHRPPCRPPARGSANYRVRKAEPSGPGPDVWNRCRTDEYHFCDGYFS